jgi:hypothetical protein
MVGGEQFAERDRLIEFGVVTDLFLEGQHGAPVVELCALRHDQRPATTNRVVGGRHRAAVDARKLGRRVAAPREAKRNQSFLTRRSRAERRFAD